MSHSYRIKTALSRRKVLQHGAAGLGLILLSPFAWASEAWQQLDAAKQILNGATPITQGLTLDLPHVSEDGSAVPLGIQFNGDLADDDYLTDIHLFAAGNPQPEIATFRLNELSRYPDIATRVRLNETQHVVAIAKSHQGETFAVSQEVRITVSGCLMRSEDSQTEPLTNPRVSVNQQVAAGDPLEVRTLINHPMETGLREDSSGERLPRHIIEQFTVRLGDEVAFEAELHQSISANPYLRFHLTPHQSGELVFEWQDDQDEQAQHTSELSVS